MAGIQTGSDSELAIEAARLASDASGFQTGELTAADFRAKRVVQGIYEQRQGSGFMLRIRLPGGAVHADQLEAMGRLALGLGVARLHLTTRQAIQWHDLELKTALKIQQAMLAVGLSSYGSGGNTVRNVTAEPLSGLLVDHAFDVRPYVIAVTSKYLGPNRHPSLPRKFKIAFSASAEDRAGARIADLGLIARTDAGKKGFQVFVAGGLGSSPALALELFPWLADTALLTLVESVIAIFAEHGERTNRHQARLRHLRKRLGDGHFLELCRRAFGEAQKSAAGPEIAPAESEVNERCPTSPSQLPDGYLGHPGIVAEVEAGRYSVRLLPPHGDVTPLSLLAAANVARDFGRPTLRVGLEQDLWLTGIGGNAIDLVNARLRGVGLGTPEERCVPVVACSGASTCQLGLLRARDAAAAIEQQLAKHGGSLRATTIRISGCKNACGRHLVARLGLEGRLKHVGARPLPCFTVSFGGSLRAGEARFARPLGIVPAKRVGELVAEIAALEGTCASPLEQETKVTAIVEGLATLPTAVPEDWFTDWGAHAPFSLSGLGEGECATAV